MWSFLEKRLLKLVRNVVEEIAFKLMDDCYIYVEHPREDEYTVTFQIEPNRRGPS